MERDATQADPRPGDPRLRKAQDRPPGEHADERPTIGVETLGCRLNQYESDGIIQKFAASGRYRAVSLEAGPDIVIVNSCTVTDQADSRNRSLVQRIRKRNPGARVVFTGCMAQTDPDKARAIPGVELVVGNDRKPALFEIVDEFLKSADSRDPAAERRMQSTAVGGKATQADGNPVPAIALHQTQYYAEPTVGDKAMRDLYAPRPVMERPFAYGDALPFGHTRAYLKIQDGCDRKCTYCKIPAARGRGVSRSARDIVDRVRRLQDEGVPEITLTGVNLGWYRDRSFGAVSDRKSDLRFIGLIEKILESLGAARLRLSSIEPCDVDASLAELTLHPRMCDFLHVPLQSGSARILKAMRRTYSPESFRRRLETVLRINPRISLGTDVIVGFPGESERDFQDSLDLCAELGMANIHGFRYSKRAGTPASGFADHVSGAVVKKRMQRLQQAREDGWTRYAAAQTGSEREGVLEKLEIEQDPQSPNRAAVAGLVTDNYLRVSVALNETQFAAARKGQMRRLRLDRISAPFCLEGTLVDEPGR